MRPEQKNIALMEDIVQRFTRANILVLDAGAGTFSVGKAYMLISKHRAIVRRKADPQSRTEEMPQPILFYAREL